MKIVVVGNNCGHGGAQEAFRRLVEFLERRGDSVRTVSIGAEAPFEDDRARLLRLDIARLPRHSDQLMNKFQKFLTVIGARRRVWRFGPDLLIGVGLSNSATVFARSLKGKAFRLAYDFIADRNSNSSLFQQALKDFDAIGLQAKAMRVRLSAQGIDAQKLLVLPCIPKAQSSRQAKKGTSKPGKPIRLAYFGRLAANKGLTQALAAFRMAFGNSGEVSFDIWGSGSEEEAIAAGINENDLTSSVILRGPFPDGEAAEDLMVSYDGICVPSLGAEGIPLVLLEAMALGVPVLCTDVGAMRDTTEDNPDFLLATPGLEGLAQGFSTFRERLVSGQIDHARLRQYYDENFSVERVTETWNTFLATREL